MVEMARGYLLSVHYMFDDLRQSILNEMRWMNFRNNSTDKKQKMFKWIERTNRKLSLFVGSQPN